MSSSSSSFPSLPTLSNHASMSMKCSTLYLDQKGGRKDVSSTIGKEKNFLCLHFWQFFLRKRFCIPSSLVEKVGHFLSQASRQEKNVSFSLSPFSHPLPSNQNCLRYKVAKGRGVGEIGTRGVIEQEGGGLKKLSKQGAFFIGGRDGRRKRKKSHVGD